MHVSSVPDTNLGLENTAFEYHMELDSDEEGENRLTKNKYYFGSHTGYSYWEDAYNRVGKQTILEIRPMSTLKSWEATS